MCHCGHHQISKILFSLAGKKKCCTIPEPDAREYLFFGEQCFDCGAFLVVRREEWEEETEKQSSERSDSHVVLIFSTRSETEKIEFGIWNL